MCGIFGYIGPKQNVSELIFEGLKTLEYRGYDSWGIAVKNEDKLAIEKQTGKLPNELPESSVVNLKSSIGIGHTRWATHGGVTIENAHPHLDCTGQIAVIHNGIVENFQELKDELLEKGHTFVSETDTEVIVHLLEDSLTGGTEFNDSKAGVARLGDPHRAPAMNMRTSDGGKERQDPISHKPAKSFTHAMSDTFNKLHGLNAVVAVNSSTSEIVAAKNGSPLLVGIGNEPGEYFLASDATGIIKHTKEVIFIEDHQMVSISSEKTAGGTVGKAPDSAQSDNRTSTGGKETGTGPAELRLFSLPENEEIEYKVTKLDWDFSESEKGDYPHFILKEIHEQPLVIENIALTYSGQADHLANLIENAFGTFLLACGSASYAALAGTYLFSNIAKKHINFTIGSEFKYLEDYVKPQTLVIPISQSGETIDVVEPVQKAKGKGATIAALVNVLGSTIYRQADHKIVLGAGQEKAVVATKSFMAMFAILLMTAYALVKNQNAAKDALITAGKNITQMLEDSYTKNITDLAKEIKDKEHIYILGRGLSYATAMEATLKIKETSYVHAEGFAGGELKHGVMALIEEGTPCIVFAPNDETYEEIISNAQEVKARGGFIIGIGPKNNKVFDRFFETADAREATLMPQVVVAQLLAYYLALARGLTDPDKPRNLAKSVTVK